MGKIDLGILGPVHGKVGPVIGAVWKGIAYLKGYAVPSNPNTSAQQTQRAAMSRAVLAAQEFISDLIPTLWNPVAVKMSGYNYFVQQNIAALAVGILMDADCVTSKGTLEDTPLIVHTYDTATGVVAVTFNDTPTGNGLATDKIYLTAWENSSRVGHFADSTSTRTDGSASITIPTGYTASNVRVYISFQRGSGSEFMVSDSDNDICDAA